MTDKITLGLLQIMAAAVGSGMIGTSVIQAVGIFLIVWAVIPVQK